LGKIVLEKAGLYARFFLREKSMTRLLVVAVVMLPLALSAAEPADLVLRNGAIYTVDAARTWAQAIAVTGNRIVFVGSNGDVDAFVSQDTRVIDVEGRMVLPGFQDSHIHPITASLKSYMCNLYGLKTVAAYLEKVKGCVAEHGASGWIHGTGWSHELFPDDAKPTARMLDEIAPDVPLTLNSYDGHSLWVNSKAMEVAGVSAETPDPPSGGILRYPVSGEPTGLFLEDQAQTLIMVAKPPYSDEVVYEGLLSVQKYLNSLGITSVQDALVDVDSGGQYSVLPTYRKAAEKGDLTLRVVGSLYWEPSHGMEQVEDLLRAREEFSTGLFAAISVKIWYDGVMHTRTSKLIEPYADRESEFGMSLVTPGRLEELAVVLDDAGFQLHFHADGDLAIRECLDAVEAALVANGPSDNRHHIAHLELIHPEDIPRFRQLGVIANVQPMWSTYPPYIDDLVENKIGKERSRWLEINRSFLKHGVMVAYGSDWFVTSPNPMDLIEAAVTRIRPSLPLEEKRASLPPLPGEEVNIVDAIASYTIHGAYVNHQEDVTGSIEVGKLADIVVLSDNLFDVEANRISETEVLLTVMDGNVVHDTLLEAQ
jgi:predicted amidohydrolase YtcJ